MKLLSRDQFREAVFGRDSHKCVICGDGPDVGVNIDAHHIIERRLWSDGGYYLENGATLCDKGAAGCHYQAETTDISVEDIRAAAGITKIVVPEDMYADHVYDKWGNICMEDGRRSKGPLFNDESVQKVLQQHPDYGTMFTSYVKYPRSYHCPWSPGITDDDRVMKDMSVFEGKEVVATEKLDGENFSGYRDYCHARSIDGRSHYTRNWAKSFWAKRSYELPVDWRVCAENMYAVHSIKYTNLPGYLIGFSIWDENNYCLSWDDTVEWFAVLNMPHVPVLYRGVYNEDAIKKLWNDSKYDSMEGYVIRLADQFHYSKFNKSLCKFVRPRHVQSSAHWMYGQNNHELNELEKSDD